MSLFSDPDKVHQTLVLIQNHHLTVILETRTNDFEPLMTRFLQTHRTFFHTAVSKGRKGQGVAIFLHNSIVDCFQLWKLSTDYQAVWLKACGSIFGVTGRVILGGIYINPQSANRGSNDISDAFNSLHSDIIEAGSISSHVLLMGDFNARLDNAADSFPEHPQLLDMYPQLGQARLSPLPNARPNTAGRCLLNIAATTPLIVTTGRGKGDFGQPTFFGYNAAATSFSRTEHLAMSPDLFSNCSDIEILHNTNRSDHRPLACRFSYHAPPNIDTRLPRHNVRQRRTEKIVWKEDLQEAYVTGLMEDEHALQLFQDSVQGNDAESAYAHFTSLILRAARNAGMTVRRMPRRVRLGLPVAPWFDATCRSLKAQINRCIKHNLPLTQLRRDYKSYCKSRKRVFLKQRAEDMVGLIDSRSADIYKMMKAQKRVDTTPISADAWTAHLEQHFKQPVENDFRLHARLPTRHQALSNQLRSRLVLPSDLAVPPGPGGRYRQDAVVNPPADNLQLPPPATHYELPSVESLISYVRRNVSRMNLDSSPGFDHFATPFIKKAERHYRDGLDKLRKENVLLSTLTDLFHLLLSSGVLPQPWLKTKITPLHKKGALSDPKNYRMLAINGCVYRLFSNVVRDLLTEWALAEHQIPDTQFGFCTTRNTNQPLFIIRHVLTCAKNEQKKVYAAFLDLLAAYDNVQRPWLWDHLQNIGTPQHLLQTVMAMYRGGVYTLIDGDKISGEVAPDKGLKQGCPLSPLLYSLFTNDLARFLSAECGAMTAVEHTKVPNCDYADDIVLMTNSPTHLQSQLDRFYRYTQRKGLELNTDKTKTMAFYTAGPTSFLYNGTPLEAVDRFKYLGVILTKDGRLKAASDQMASTFMGTIQRVRKAGSQLHIWNRKHAMLWLFQTFALSAGLYGCQIWATPYLSYTASCRTTAHANHVGFLKSLLGVKKATETHCVLRETGQMPLFFYWFRCTVRFWNCLLNTNNSLLLKIVQADLRFANVQGSWTCQFLHALNDVPNSDTFSTAVRTQNNIHVGKFETVLREHIISDWRAAQLPRQMHTYHTHFGTPLGSESGWWDDEKRSKKPVLPHYLRQDIPHKALRSLSCLRLSGHEFQVQIQRYNQGVPYEQRVCDRCALNNVQDEAHVILDCPDAQLVSLRNQFQHLFDAIPAGSTARLRDFINQSDAVGVADFADKCLALFDH